jgi:peptidoglycan/LPS O-acetylase OafA/YrhL
MTSAGPELENTANPSFRPPYRPEIDGLRALAVIAVIIHHFNKNSLPSGYLGVDIFFVISGFVITSALAGRPAQNFGDFLLGFYSRRIKRLVPALVAFVLIASGLICVLNPDPVDSLRAAKNALFGLSNLTLYLSETDYFAPSSELNVFTHTWSLGVEEQFYLVFPFLAWFSGFGQMASNGAKNLLYIIGALFIASLIGFFYLEQTNPTAAYFLMPTRFWELATGCLLWIALNHTSRWQRVLPIGPPLLVTAGILGILFVPFQFAVPATVAIVALTAVLIASLRAGTAAYRLFTHPLVVYVGLISYSLYLWHWGVLALSRWTIGIHWWSIPFQILLMLVLSMASYQYIETPFRHSQGAALRGQAIGYGLAALCGAFLLLSLLSENNSALLLKGVNDIPAPPAFLPLKFENLTFNPTCVVDGKERPLRNQTFDQCTTLPKVAGGQMIWALGDSHIGHLQGLLYKVYEQMGLGVHLIETPGVPFPMHPQRVFKERAMIYETIKQRLQPGDIVMVSRLFIEREPPNRPIGELSKWGQEVLTLADDLAAKGVNLVIMGPPPMFRIESLDMCRSSLWKDFRADCSVERAQISASIDQVYSLLAFTSGLRKNIYVFNQFELLCPASQRQCSLFKEGVLAFRDKDHLNTHGSTALANPFMAFLRHLNLLKRTVA